MVANGVGGGIVGNAQIGSIVIKKGTTLVSDNPPYTINATLNFSNGNYFDIDNNASFSSVQITLKWAGYQTYTPTNPHATTDTVGSALEFVIVSVGEGTTTDGQTLSLSNVSSASLLDALTALAPRIALLPTYEPNVIGSTENLSDVTTAIPTLNVCFLEGTEIKTPIGNVKIEDIKIGDTIISIQNGKEIESKVVEIRKNNVDVHSKEDWPVCIKKNSLEHGVPYQDLYVTGDHCLYINGNLIPSRMLVNNASIVKYDMGSSNFATYHIECDAHVIVVANGALAESYLDTNHSVSKNVVLLGEKNWHRDAAAPLCTDTNIVRPLSNALAIRAQKLGYEVSTLDNGLYTNDPDFYLETEEGRKIYPYKINNGNYFFFLPKTVSNLFLVSRTFSPSEVEGPYVDDRRLLGVMIGEISFYTPNMKEIHVTTHLHKKTLPGWHDHEFGRFRWISSRASLPLSEIWGELCKVRENVVLFKIEVIHNGKYKIKNEKNKIIKKTS